MEIHHPNPLGQAATEVFGAVLFHEELAMLKLFFELEI